MSASANMHLATSTYGWHVEAADCTVLPWLWLRQPGLCLYCLLSVLTLCFCSLPVPHSYNNPHPVAEDYAKEPPVMPPHLQLTLLNVPSSTEGAASLPRPQHVILNHIYIQRGQVGGSVLVRVMTCSEPIWAWDRALNNVLQLQSGKGLLLAADSASPAPLVAAIICWVMQCKGVITLAATMIILVAYDDPAAC
eukprot:GHRR01022835.1.p1 GENE.GHRR01022835.1~~GHRR01022835.1.p1  ORF type:complete len:194 (-),score=26.97 GHRR01022835.1:264-845(-)